MPLVLNVEAEMLLQFIATTVFASVVITGKQQTAQHTQHTQLHPTKE